MPRTVIEFEPEVAGQEEGIFKSFCAALRVRNAVMRQGDHYDRANISGLWNIRRWDGEWMGATVHAEDAAAMVAFVGEKATVEWEHLIVWREGEKFDGEAAESYDRAAERMQDRRRKHFGR